VLDAIRRYAQYVRMQEAGDAFRLCRRKRAEPGRVAGGARQEQALAPRRRLSLRMPATLYTTPMPPLAPHAEDLVAGMWQGKKTWVRGWSQSAGGRRWSKASRRRQKPVQIELEEGRPNIGSRRKRRGSSSTAGALPPSHRQSPAPHADQHSSPRVSARRQFREGAETGFHDRVARSATARMLGPGRHQLTDRQAPPLNCSRNRAGETSSPRVVNTRRGHAIRGAARTVCLRRA